MGTESIDVGGLTRRHFLALSGVAGAGVALGLPLEARASNEDEAMKLFREGFELAQKGLYNEALAAYEGGLKLNNKTQRLARIKSTEAGKLYDLGLAVVNTDQDEAINHFSNAAKLEPDNSYIYSNLAWAYAKKGATDEAINYFKKALSLRPNDPISIGALGKFLTQKGNHKEAYFWNKLHLKFEPNSKYLNERLGYIGQNEAALKTR